MHIHCRRVSAGLFALGASLAALAPATAQTVAPGYERSEYQRNEFLRDLTFGPYKGQQVYWTGTDLMRDTGASTVTLLSTGPSLSLAGFLCQVDNDTVVFGKAFSGDIWQVKLTPGAGAPVLLKTVPNLSDGAAWDASTVLISVLPPTAADFDVLALDLITGNTDVIATIPRLAYNAGSIAVSKNGDLVTVSGFTDVIAFDQAQVLSAFGPTALNPIQSNLIGTVGSAGDVLVDKDNDVFVVLKGPTDSLVEIKNMGAGSPQVIYTPKSQSQGVSLSQLELLPSAGPGAMEEFQPGGAGIRMVEEQCTGSGYFINCAYPKVELRTARPEMISSTGATVPPGPVTVTVQGAAAGAIGQMWVAFGPSLGEVIVPTGLPVAELILVDPAMNSPLSIQPLVFDSSGTASFSTNNPGGFPQALPLLLQSVFFTVDLRAIGTTAPLSVTLSN